VSDVVGDILQPTHLIFILVIALLVLGPKRLPEVGRSLGRGLRDFKGALSGEEPEHHHDEVTSSTATASAESPPAFDPEPTYEPPVEEPAYEPPADVHDPVSTEHDATAEAEQIDEPSAPMSPFAAMSRPAAPEPTAAADSEPAAHEPEPEPAAAAAAEPAERAS
jgi:sec-independent protein translocase protein TatA